jgi:hypothetical protein
MEGQLIPWPDFVRDHPRFSDVADTCVPFRGSVPALVLPEHPLFAPWRREIGETAPIRGPLRVPEYHTPEAIEPTADDCFAHGRVAWLDRAEWPRCGRCSRALEMCLQVSPAVMADWVPERGGFVAMYCFHCGTSERTDPAIACVRFVVPSVRVVHPDEAWESASSGWMAATQRVTPQGPSRLPPDAMWHRLRSEVTPDTAASVLLIDDPIFAGPFPAGVDPDEMFDDLGEELDDWIHSSLPNLPYPGAFLGGYAEWDQVDETPSCPGHGEMLHLLDYGGGQFLDGALHVFLCRDTRCGEVRFVAEL